MNHTDHHKPCSMTVLRVFPRRGADEEERGDSMAEKEAQRENMSGEGSMCGQLQEKHSNRAWPSPGSLILSFWGKVLSRKDEFYTILVPGAWHGWS